jgi:hypothetical protein
MFRLKHAASALVLAAAACTGDVTAPAAPGDGGPTEIISDAAHAGAVPGFYFLPPMVPAPSYSGTFDGGLQPRVEICQVSGPVCGPVIAQYTTASGTGGERVQVGASSYQVNWHTNQFTLDPAQTYRISVYVGTFRLGFADVDVVSSGKELKNVNTQQYIALQDGRTLPIKFRIETGIAGRVIVLPDSASIPIGGTQQFTATVLDLHGNPVASPTVTWSSSSTGVATVNGSGLATGVGTGVATITATSQAASGSATLTVINPNTPPLANPDTFAAIGNVTVPVTAPGVLANDADGEGNPLAVVAGTFPTAAGGTVTLNADGSFSYLSAAGFTGQDSFAYTVTDGTETATGTVTVGSAYRVWYVDNSATAPGDGRDASPFVLLKDAETASAVGETLFLRYGNGTSAGYDDGIVLKTGQSLTGQGVPASVTATLNGQTVVLLAAGSAPTVTRAGPGVTVQVSTGNVIQGFDVGSTAGAGIAGTGFGTLTVGSMSVAANGGPALDLSSGDVFGAFGALSSSGSTGAGIRLLGIGGSFSAAGGTITGAATAGVDVTGGDAVFSYGGDIVATGPLAVFVGNRTGGALTFGGTIASTGNGIGVQNNSGGTIAFNGASKSLATGAHAGVRLLNNAGASISFGGGGLAIATTGGTGFEATGGGTVTVTGAGNTIVAAAGTGLKVDNTTIGEAGLSFRSINASGGSNGIMLSNTGVLNGLQVTGTGTAGSGGTISEMSGADGSTQGIGVYLKGVRSVSLSHMALSGFDNFAIRGVDVNGFEMDGTVVSGASGTSAALAEGAISFTGLTGAAFINDSQVSGGFTDNVSVANAAGTLNRLIVSGSTIGQNGSASGDDGVVIEATGSAVVNVTVQNSTFAGARADLFQMTLANDAASDLVFSGNSLSNGQPSPLSGGGGVLLSSTSGSPALTYSVTGNTVRGTTGAALSIIKGVGTGTFTGSVSNNVIGQPGVSNSGSSQGSGIIVDLIGGGGHTASVTGNQVFQFTNFGIRAQAGSSSLGGQGVLKVVVQGNTVSQPSANAVATAFPTHGIRIQSGVTSGDNSIVCATVGGAGALANTVTATGINGGTDIRLFERFLTTMALTGYAGAPGDNAAAAAFTQANNGGTPTVQATNNVAAGGPGLVGTCPT